MNRLLISEINEIESIIWDEYENVQICQSVDSFFIFTHFFFIIFSQNREITLLVDWQISRIRRIEFYREKDKKIEFNKFCRFDLDQIHIFFNIITFDHRLDDHNSLISVIEFFENEIRLRHCWIDDERHLRYRTDSKIDETTKNKMKRKDETVIQSINKRLWVMRRSSACRAHNCRILLTDERMNC